MVTVPTFLGPILVHQRKLKELYHYLISSIIGAHPPLSHILAIGTDWESNLSAAILNNLPFAQHVRCAVHQRRDIQEKMKEMVCQNNTKAYLLKMLWDHFIHFMQQGW